MKTKLSALLTACFMLFSICTKAQTTVQDRQAMAMLKEFYTAYMTEMAGTTGSEKELDALKKKYCTAKLIRNIPKLGEKDDCDPIIKAQDSNTENVKTLSVKKDNTKPNTYAISYADTDFFSKKITVINIHASVVKQADGFKMDNVWQYQGANFTDVGDNTSIGVIMFIGLDIESIVESQESRLSSVPIRRVSR